MKNILLLTDFSDTSRNAISYSLQLMKDELCTFFLLYIQDSTAYTTDDIVANSSSNLYSSIIEKHQKKLIEYIATLEAKFANKNHNFHTIVDFDSVVEATNQTIKSKNIDLVVMGTNGTTGAKEVIFGSNTINVIRNVNCKTLIIPENHDFTPPKSMLLALDPFDKLNGKAIREFYDFFKVHDMELHVLRINSGDDSVDFPDSDKHDLNYFLKGKKFIYNLIDDIPMDNAVSTYLQTNSIDMISLFVQKETLFERLFIGSPTTKINRDAKFPLFIFHT